MTRSRIITAPLVSLAPSLITAALVLVLGGCASGHRQVPLAPHDPATSAGDITVYAAGDIADCRKMPPAATMAARSAELIATGFDADSSAVVLTLGDNVYQSGTPAEHADCYAPTWGRFKARTLPVPGNHEYYSKDATGYFEYFGDLAGPGRRGYYSTELGDWHVMALNSNLRGDAMQAQLDWLKADLAAHPSGCALAYWHHPRWSSGGHGSNIHMDAIWQTLVAAGTELVLSGHDHDYERFAPLTAGGQPDAAQGMRQFVVGTGGAELTPFRPFISHSETADNTTFGVLRLTLRATGYAWDFQPVDSTDSTGKNTGGYRDHGSARCH